MNKQSYGQFYTKNSEYIIGDLILEFLEYNYDTLVDPFAGECDLLNLFHSSVKKEAYDIDPKLENIIKQDTLLNPPDYINKWIITNPPWLAKNKNKSPENNLIYKKYNTNDLYKCALKSFENCNGGIIIIPLNFWCEEQQSLRSWFLNKFRVEKVKVFEEQIFQDTTYTACAFKFIKKETDSSEQNILFEFWKGAHFKNNKFVCGYNYKTESFLLREENDYIIGSDYINFINKYKNINEIKVNRLIKNDTSKNKLILWSQDTGTTLGKIKLERDNQFHTDNTTNLTERTLAGIKISTNILNKEKEIVLNNDEQDKLCELFNNKLEEFRLKYNSLCLTNYRNSTKELSRKRISFDAAYSIIKWAVMELLEIGL